MPKETIAITSSGGDCAGINSTIASFVRCATLEGYEVVGIEKGLEGLLNPVKFIDLDLNKVKNISDKGGTILESVNKGRFGGKKGAGNLVQIPDSILDEAVSTLKRKNIDKIVIIGGDGSLSGAVQLQKKGIKLIGIPKSIDNDLDLTDTTIGFDSGVHVVMDSLQNLHTTADSHDRVLIVETMGRYTGWLSLYGGVTGGANIILIPEIQFQYDVIIDFLRSRKTSGNDSSLIVVSEGVKEPDSNELVTGDKKASEVRLGGIAEVIEDRINSIAPLEFEIRSLTLGHLQRGGQPTTEDRKLGMLFGKYAVELIKKEKFGRMLSLSEGRITDVDMKKAVARLKTVPKDHQLLQAARSNGVCFGDKMPEIIS